MLVFEERGKPECPEKDLSEQGENQQQTQPTYDSGTGKCENRTRDTLVGGDCSHHYTTERFKEFVTVHINFDIGLTAKIPLQLDLSITLMYFLKFKFK